MSGSFSGDDEIVIAGISGRFPESSDIDEFKKNLYDGVDMVTGDARRWPVGYLDLPKRTGKMKDIEKFDAPFFGIHPKQSDRLDPMIRMMLEATYEAITDAGYNIEDVRGTNTGVYIGCSGSDSLFLWSGNTDKINGYGFMGCQTAMFANRVSYTFDFKGPSFIVDTACSSSGTALHVACNAIKSGEVEAAVVGGVNLCIRPSLALQFNRLSMLSHPGACKAFDASGNGFVRSEAVVVVYLKKAKDSKRIYASVVNTGINCDGNKSEGITFPNGAVQQKLIEQVFDECGLDPNIIDYVECHGTGTKVGDPQELKSVTNFFCKTRKTPLLIGSVKSNMGHSEAGSALCSVAKIVLAMENNRLPGNLHFKTPNPDIPALHDGRLKVVSENMEWHGKYVAVNSFGFGGANFHAILKRYTKPKSPPVVDGIPRLVCVSGRTEEAVSHMINYLESSPRDDNMISLIHDVNKRHTPGHPIRGYTVLEAIQKTQEITEAEDKNEIWFVFNGVGSQWPGMGKALMCLEPFSNAIHRSAKALETVGVDLLSMIENPTPEIYDNTVNLLVGITAIQVALVDVLSSVGIKPDKMAGHSAGEVACSYADGCLTIEQTVLCAYYRGVSLIEAKVEQGAMAAVGLKWDEVVRRVPQDVWAACNNAETSVTVSGREKALDGFVQKLQSENVFVKKVNSSNTGFHSPLIAPIKDILGSHLRKLIPDAKPRSNRWLSTSIPEEKWDTEGKYLTADYFVNNMLMPVQFHPVISKIPENSIVIEIGGHSLLQAILKRAVPSSCVNIGFAKKEIPDELSYLMSNIGKLYLLGKTPDISALYRRPNYPVPSGTPMIAPLIKWDHSQNWAVADYKDIGGSDECVFEIDTSKEKHAYINGHCIDGRVLFPATGYLTLIWNAYAKLVEKQAVETPVVMTNVSILRATIMPKDGVVKFSVNINKASGSFELSESGSTVVTGFIEKSEGICKEGLNLKPPVSDQKVLPLQKDEIYKDLRLRGYNYKGIFQGIKSSDNFGTNGILEWNDDWISFMDTMLQFSLVGMNTRELYLPTRILKMTIDPEAHLQALNGSHEIPVHMHQKTGIVKSGGIEIRNMKASQAPRRINDQPPPKTEQYCFVPFKINKETPWEDAVSSCLQIVIENSKSRHIKVAEVYQKVVKSENLATPFIIKTMESEPLTKATVKVFCLNTDGFSKVLEPFDVEVKKKDLKSGPVGENLNLIVTSAIGNLQNALDSICEGGFIMTDSEIDSLQTISSIKTEKGQVVLLRKVKSIVPNVVEVDSNFDWVEKVKETLKTEKRTIIMSDKEPDSGILGFFNCLRQEPGGENLRCLFVADDSKFDLKTHEDQLKKDLLINVFKNGQWGSMRHLRINVDDMESEKHHAYINTLVKGDLSSLRWIQGPLSFFKPEHDPTKELCTVYYSTLNFKDVMLASGKLPPDALPGRQSEMECILGFEYAGRDTNGTRTMGLVTAQAMATTVLADKSLKWPIPSKWTMAEASTIPAVYATSYYAMIIRGRLQKGEKVLIHAGTGGVGQAAIRIALSMNCEIFTTVGSQEKKEFLLKTFPRLNPANIGNSRDTSFEQLILERTEGQGVHIVLNSLAGEMLQASVRCLAEGGRFLEIGKADISQNTPIGMSILKKSVAVHGILLDAVFEIEGESEVKKEIRDLIQNGIESGVVVPLQTNIYHHSQVEQAFRFMASGKHIGKVILEIKKEEQSTKNVVPEKVMAIPKTYFSADKSYIVLGGLGGFGLEMANWMLMRGARHLILVSRKGVSTGYQALCLRRWKERGYDVIIRTDDATTMKGARNLLVDANKLAPVGGIFNLAAVLRDALMENLSKNDFEAVCKVKVDVCKNLDIASQSLCSQLDYFVMFSSVSSGRGNMGQTNYGWANSSMERICEKRRALGLPGMAIQWGAIGDVGLVIESLKLDNDATIGGTLPQRITSCLNTLDSFLQTPYPVVSSIVLPERGAKAKDKNAKSLVEVVGNILGVKNVQTVAKTTTLADLGMDSLMGAEIKQVLERGYDLIMNAAEIRNLTFGSLDTLSGGNASENKIEEVKVLVRYEDRLMPDQTLVKMKSGDASVSPLFFIHAIEGTVTALKTIVDAIKSPGEVYGLQSTIDIPSGTIRDMARAYIKEIKTVQPKGPYRLVGYSFGGTVAYEMAYLLENEYKEESFIVFIDSSPTYVVSQTKNYRSVRNEDADVKDAYAFFIATFDPKTNVELVQKELERLNTEEERLQLIADKLKFLSFEEKEIKDAAFAFGKRLVASDVYKTSGKISSDALLFSAEENFVQVDLAQTVKEICRNVTIHNMKGNHRSILIGESALKIAEIISNL